MSCKPYVDSVHCPPPAEVGQHDEHAGEPDRRHPRHDPVEDAVDGQAHGDRGEERPQVAVADERASEERPEQRPEPAEPVQDAAAAVTHLVDGERQHGQQADQAGPEAESGLHRDQRGHARVAAGVRQGLPGRLEQPGVHHVLPRLGEPPVDAHDQRGGHQERRRVPDVPGLAPERGHDHAAQGGADGQHRPPQRPGQYVRDGEVLRLDQVRDGGRGGRLEEGPEGLDHADEHEREPDGGRPPHEEEAERQDSPHDVRDDHQATAIDAIGKRAAHERHHRVGHRHRRDQSRHERRRARELVDEPEQRHGQEPVPAQRDQLRDEHQPEVPVAPQQVQGLGGSAPRRARRGRGRLRGHGAEASSDQAAPGPDRRRPSSASSIGSR